MSKKNNNLSFTQFIVFSVLFESERKISRKCFMKETIIRIITGIALILPHMFFRQYSVLGIISDIASILIICNITSIFLFISKKSNMKFEYCMGIINILLSIFYLIFFKQGNIVIDVFAIIVFNVLVMKRYAAYLSNINYKKVVELYDKIELQAKEYNKKRTCLKTKHKLVNRLIKRNREYYEKYAETTIQKKKAGKELMDIEIGHVDDAEKKLNDRYSTNGYANDFCSDEDAYEYEENMNIFSKSIENAFKEINRYGDILKVIGKILQAEKKHINTCAKPLQKALPEEARQLLEDDFYEQIANARKTFQINKNYRKQLEKSIII